MKKIKTKILLFSSILLSSLAFGQGCPNLDFEDGNFNNWTGTTGTYTTIFSSPSPGIVTGRHTLMTAPGTDANTGNQLQVIAPGGSVSCRLGNDNAGYEAEQLLYSMSVTSQNALFIYRYAVVLEDPGHPANAQPTFDIKLKDSNGNLLDTVCGLYQVTAGAGIPGFQTNGSVRWKDWTTVGLDLTPYIGQTVTIEFTTRDCNYGGHFGYAYIDGACGPMEILTDYCIGRDSVTFTAPPGFTYKWIQTGDTTQSITVLGDTVKEYDVTLTAPNGCKVTLAAFTKPTYYKPQMAVQSCGLAWFGDSTKIFNGTKQIWQWDFGDGTTDTVPNPVHQYNTPGKYTVTLHIDNGLGCDTTFSREVNVYDKPIADFGWDYSCLNDSGYVEFIDYTQFTPGYDYTWNWNFGNGVTSNEQAPITSFKYPVNQTVTLISTIDGNHCADTVTKTVEFNMRPPLVAPNVFTPNADGKNDRFEIKNLDQYSDVHFWVYNRWGNKVYESENYQNDWDGKTRRGKRLDDGTYYYILNYNNCEYTDEDVKKEKTIVEKRVVTILDNK